MADQMLLLGRTPAIDQSTKGSPWIACRETGCRRAFALAFYPDSPHGERCPTMCGKLVTTREPVLRVEAEEQDKANRRWAASVCGSIRD